MNLASRCREAISHVAMLKKELSMHQRRAAEALAQQRQQQVVVPRLLPNMPSKAGTDKFFQSTADVAAEMDRMDRLMAVHAPPPPPPNPPSIVSTLPTHTPSPDDGSPKGEFFSDYDEEKKSGSQSSSEESDDELGPEVGFTKEFPHPDDYNEGFPDDLPRSARKKPASILPTAPEVSESDADTSSVSSNQSDYRRTIMSSIDAFEASFSTSFPESFSSSPHEEKAQKTEIYNPFFPSPRRDIKESSQPTSAEIAKARSGPALPRAYDEPSMLLSKNEKGAAISLAPRPRSSGAVSLDEVVPSTPPKLSREVTPSSHGTPGSQDDKNEPRTPISLICRKVSNDEYDEPRRPEKIASASARARYEKALQSRTYQPGARSSSFRGNAPEKENSEESHSQQLISEQDTPTSKPTSGETQATPPVKTPNQVLQRLQQRIAASSSASSSLRNASPSHLKSSNHKTESPQMFKNLSTAVFSKTRPVTSSKTPEPAISAVNQPAKTPEVLLLKNGVSPTVSSAIDVFEQAAKRNEGFANISGGRAGKPVRATSFGSAQTNRPASPGLPFDEYEIPRRGNFKSLSTGELGSMASRQSDEEEDFVTRRNTSQGVPAKGFQSSTTRSGHDNPNRRIEDEFREAGGSSYASRIKRASEFPPSKGLEPPSYLAQNSGVTTSNLTAGGAGRNSLRNVTKPVSYAEPSLNTKLRQGDVFFPKNDSDKRTGGDDGRKDLLASVRL